MYRVVKLSGQLYAKKIHSIGSDSENLNAHVSMNEPVIICEDLADLEVFDIDTEDIEIVD